jgi:hypothetical protein
MTGIGILRYFVTATVSSARSSARGGNWGAMSEKRKAPEPDAGAPRAGLGILGDILGGVRAMPAAAPKKLKANSERNMGQHPLQVPMLLRHRAGGESCGARGDAERRKSLARSASASLAAGVPAIARHRAPHS